VTAITRSRMRRNFTAGAPVAVYGVPQADGSLKAYVLAYYTGQLPAQ
jgi:hypothetical protein